MKSHAQVQRATLSILLTQAGSTRKWAKPMQASEVKKRELTGKLTFVLTLLAEETKGMPFPSQCGGCKQFRSEITGRGSVGVEDISFPGIDREWGRKKCKNM